MTLSTPNTRESLRTWLTDNWRALAVIWVVSLLPFLSVLFSGKVLFASDQMGSPTWHFFFDALRHGELPLWRPHSLGGMPSYDAMFGDASYPVFVFLGFLVPTKYLVTFNFVAHTLFAGFAAFLLVQRYFRIDRWIAVALAVAYALNPHYISYAFAGHTGKFFILSWLPLSLYFLLRSLGPTATWRHLLGLSLTVAIFVSTSHLQFTYFVMMGYFVVWLYFLIPVIRSKRIPAIGSVTARFWLPLLLGVGMAFPVFYPPMQYTKEFGIRGSAEKSTYEHATSWSLHPEETVSLLVPEFGGVNEKYWGRNYFKINTESPGILLWFLGLFGLIAFRKSRWFWLWSVVGSLSILYGLGAHTPVFRLFYEFVPGIKNFRAASMMLFWVGIALLAMAGETLRRLTATGEGSLTDLEKKNILKKLQITGWSVAGFLAVCGLFPEGVYSVWNSLVDLSQLPNIAAQSVAAPAFALGAFRAAVLTGLLTWGVAAFLLRARRPMAFGLLALLVTVADHYWMDSHYIKPYDIDSSIASNPAVEFLKTDTSRFRVFGIGDAYPGWYLGYFDIHTVEGWTDNEMRHYRAYRGGDYQRNPNFFAGLVQNPDGSVSGSPFLDMLNVKYVAFRAPNDPGLKLTLNRSFLPRAYFVPAWKAVTDSQALQGMKEPGFNPRALAYVTGEGLASGGQVPDSGAKLIEPVEQDRKINSHHYSVEAPSEGVMVLADMWFPHWKVRVDGVEEPLIRANFAFQGVMLKPGKHEVVFEYHSPWLRRGLQVSALSLALLALLIWLYGRFGPRRSAA